MPFAEFRHQIKYVFKMGQLIKPSLFTALQNVDYHKLSNEICLTRRDEEIQLGYRHNLAYRKSQDPSDEGTLFWERVRNYMLLLQSKSRSIA